MKTKGIFVIAGMLTALALPLGASPVAATDQCGYQHLSLATSSEGFAFGALAAGSSAVFEHVAASSMWHVAVSIVPGADIAIEVFRACDQTNLSCHDDGRTIPDEGIPGKLDTEACSAPSGLNIIVITNESSFGTNYELSVFPRFV